MNQNILTRIAASSFCASITALIWDGWWHVSVGRDTFWEPPHIVLYSSVVVAFIMSILGWYATREKIWKKIAIVAALIPLSAPLDNAWHNFFGVENLETVLIIWSPPHLFLFGSLIAGLISILPLVKKDPWASNFLGNYSLAVLMALSLGIAAPFYPLGPYKILGFGGAGIMAMVTIGYLFFASRWNEDFGASSVALFFIALYFLQDIVTKSSWVKIPAFPHIPQFIFFFSTLIPAIFIDLKLKASLFTGAVTGLIYGILYYGFTSSFLAPEFQYSPQDMLIGVITSIVGGAIAGLTIDYFFKEKSNDPDTEK